VATSLIISLSLKKSLATLVSIIFPGSLMDKHQKVTVTPTSSLLIQPTLCLTPDSNTIVQEHSVFSHTLSHTLLINCITTSLGGHQLWPTVRDVYILYVGLWNWLLRISRLGNSSYQ
jgi:hypothetical protein